MKQVWDRLRSELVEIIEWSDAVPGAPSPGGDTLAWRFAAADNPGSASTIRNGAQLIVREGQWAVFLDEGRIADAFGPGRHTLSTANLPLLTSLLCLPTGFESPFRAEVHDGAKVLAYDTNQCAIVGARRTKGALKVREFYTQQLVSADTVGFVEESDVLGPMGPDPIPVALDKLTKFQKDHGGKERALSAILEGGR
jgi:membrane protease subunit (stomatin/prohibitin family)